MWRRVLLGASTGAVFGLVITAFLVLTGVMASAVGTLPMTRIATDALVRSCEQLVPWLLLWLILLPALLRLRWGQPWLALAIYTGLAVVLVPKAIDATDLSTSQLIGLGVFALVTGLPIVRAADVWLSASFLVALHIVTVSIAGLPFGSTAAIGAFDSRLSGDVLLTGGRLGPVFGIFGMLGLAWVAGAILQHQRLVFAGTAHLASGRRAALSEFGLGIVTASAAAAVMFVTTLVTLQSRIAEVTPSVAAVSATLRTNLPAVLASQWLWSFVVISVVFVLVRRGWIAVVVATAASVTWHLMAPGTTALTASSVGAIALATGWAYVETGRLWMPIGLAYGWALCEGAIFGFASGGFPVRLSWFRQDILQYTAWSGGVHGPDASLIGLIAKAMMVVAVVYVCRVRRGSTR